MTNKLYHKNFNILVLGQIISLFGSSIQRFALSLYLLDLTGSASLFASILAVSMIPIVLISPIAGILADRGNKKKLMVFLDVASSILLLGYLIIVLQGNDQVGIVAVVMVLLSTISTIYQPVVNTCIPILVAESHLVKANAIIQQVASLSNFLGPILAGMLYGWLGIKGVIVINMLSFLCSALMEVFLDLPQTKRAKQDSFLQVFVGDMKESYIYLKDKNPIIFRMLLFSGFYNLFLVPVFSVAAPYLIKVTFGLSSEVYGMAEGMIALGMILGGVIITWKPLYFHIKRVHRLLYLTSISMFVMGISISLFQSGRGSNVTSVMLFILFGMVIMGVLGIANVLSAAYLYQEAESTLLGKVLAFGSAFATLCIPLGQILFGGLIENFAVHIDWIIYGAAVLVFGVTLLVRWNVLQIEGD
ncbi:MFS transporter [Niameybacter massiliensis]|uniref:MFS transporter n=1 Tax=Holtiella tumoricola TaxID=3018743 RepID=A0AA42DK79_9FIRM|nr:MFS transporter [Holtiella tumoricola]MDA3730597.1 MFS transporter [Holtiella tumoricola]